jgi:hypothetical protein
MTLAEIQENQGKKRLWRRSGQKPGFCLISFFHRASPHRVI